MALTNTVVVTTTNSSVTLSCEIFGYLPRGSQPQITWRTRMGGPGTSSIPISSSNPLYTISTSDGSRQIQNGGSTPRPSLVSSLTIDVLDESVAGEYVCSGPSSVQTIVLNVQQGGVYNNNAHIHHLSFYASWLFFFYLRSASTDSPIISTESGGPTQGVTVGNSMLPVIIGLAAGGVVVIIVVVIIIIIVIIVFVMRANNRGEPTYDLPADSEPTYALPADSEPTYALPADSEPTYDLPADYEKPLAPPVKTIPPRLEMKENIVYEQIKSFDMTANSAYS